jgi:hypothetical protein
VVLAGFNVVVVVVGGGLFFVSLPPNPDSKHYYLFHVFITRTTVDSFANEILFCVFLFLCYSLPVVVTCHKAY